MGCSAAINAIRLANHIVRSEPSAWVLMVNIELCSLHLKETRELERLMSGLLFGDGCAAAMISSDARGIALRDFRTVTIPSSAHLKIGRAHVGTPVTNEQLVCRLLLEKNKKHKRINYYYIIKKVQ